jgi:hypothetical protein
MSFNNVQKVYKSLKHEIGLDYEKNKNKNWGGVLITIKWRA